MHIQIRGGSGSGKSSLVRRLIAEHQGQIDPQPDMPEFIRTNGKRVRPQLRRLTGDLWVLGTYDLERHTSQGADCVSGVLGIEMMDWYAPRFHHLVWEGNWASSHRADGDWLAMLLRHGMVWATLDTTTQQGYDNIWARRLWTGRSLKRPMPNWEKFQHPYRDIHRHVPFAEAAGIRNEWLNFPDRAYDQLHGLLSENGWVCDSPDCRAPPIDMAA
jgi:hypothetical protein